MFSRESKFIVVTCLTFSVGYIGGNSDSFIVISISIMSKKKLTINIEFNNK